MPFSVGWSFVAMLTIGAGAAAAGGATEATAMADGTGWAFSPGGVLAVIATGLARTLRRLPAEGAQH